MVQTAKRTWVEIDLDALIHNYELVKSKVGPACKVLAVIKADAYGHGAVPVARALEAHGADYFAVSSIDEAIEIRKAGIKTPVLILGYTDPSMTKLLCKHHITQTVTTLDNAKAFSNQARRLGLNLTVHIKIDTGMSRLGLDSRSDEGCQKSADQAKEIALLPHIYAEGIFTHFAVADTPSSDFTNRQFAHFKKVLDLLKKQGVDIPIRHCCNSAGTLNFSHMHLDMVRMGIILYGLSPDHGMDDTLDGFIPALSIKSVTAQVKELDKGDTISYGRIYTADKPMRTATVPIGYADGYMRLLSNKAHMLIRGHRVSQVGRICMDQCMVDITDYPDICQGDVVTVVGKDGDACIPVGEIAGLMDTIDYEFVCILSKRMPRIYVKNKKECEYVTVLT